MSDAENDDIQTSREEERLTYEMYFLIVRTICEKGVVKISDLRKVYQKTVSNDKTVQYRSIQEILASVNENLKHWQGWSAVLNDDRLTYVDVNGKMPVGNSAPNETERILGILKSTLMYIFVATRPVAAHPGVTHEDLMSYLETSLATSNDHKLSSSEMDILKKLISPNARSDFVKKGYLAWTKSVNDNEEEVFRYEWGPYARQTVDPINLVKIYQKLTGMSDAELKEPITRAVTLKKEQDEAVERGAILATRGRK